MPKLIRLVGSDDKEIKNFFKSPLIIGAKSTIALQNLSVEFNEALIKEFFTIDGNNNSFTLTADGLSAPATLEYTGTEQEYDLAGFLQEVSASANWSPNNGQYLDYTSLLNGNYFVLSGQKCSFSPTVFSPNASSVWNQVGGDVAPTFPSSGSIKGDVASTSEIMMLSKLTAPRVACRFRATTNLVGGATRDWSIGLCDPDDATYTIIAGMGARWDGLQNVLVLIENGVDVATADSGTVANGFVQFEYNGAGAWRAGRTNGATPPVYIDGGAYDGTALTRTVATKSMKWVIKFPAGGDQQLGAGTANNAVQITTTSSDRVNSMEHLTGEVFTSTITVPDNRLRKYLGFPDGTMTARGDPAILQGKDILDGDNSLPGILVTLNNILLESYDGEVGRTSNILAVVNEFVKNQRAISYSATFPVKIDLNNANPVNLNEIKMSFLSQADGKRLEFSGKAVATLLVYDE